MRPQARVRDPSGRSRARSERRSGCLTEHVRDCDQVCAIDGGRAAAFRKFRVEYPAKTHLDKQTNYLALRGERGSNATTAFLSPEPQEIRPDSVRANKGQKGC